MEPTLRTYFREALKSPIVIFALLTLVTVVILAPVFGITTPK